MGKKLHLTNLFHKGFNRLSRQHREEAHETIYELSSWPDIPAGRNKEKLRDVVNGSLFSLRVSLHVRMIIQVNDDGTFLLVAIGPHDEVYKNLGNI